jgi:hypothetical protein
VEVGVRSPARSVGSAGAMPRRRRALLVGTLAGLLLAVTSAGCGGGGDAPIAVGPVHPRPTAYQSAAPSTPTPTPTPSHAPSPSHAPKPAPTPKVCRYVSADEIGDIVDGTNVDAGESIDGPGCDYTFWLDTTGTYNGSIEVAVYPGAILPSGTHFTVSGLPAYWDSGGESLQVKMGSGVVYIKVEIPSGYNAQSKSYAMAVFRAARHRLP